jgi:hypothetical protein
MEYFLLALAIAIAIGSIVCLVLAIGTHVPPPDRKMPPHKWHRF